MPTPSPTCNSATINNGCLTTPLVKPWGQCIDLDKQPLDFDRRLGDVLRWEKPSVGLLYDQPALYAAVLNERKKWQRIANAAQAVTTGCDDRINFFRVPSHLMASLALSLDERPDRSSPSEDNVTIASIKYVPDKFMVFDVESIGLHGEGFAVAWVVVSKNGEKLSEGILSCDPQLCNGQYEDRRWVRENVPELELTSPTKLHLRNAFWHEWRRWAENGAVLVADCAWPVETNFLSACIRQNLAEREWAGPYPLYDLSSVVLALGGNPLSVTERLPDERPAHNPLMDARQSARQLINSLKLNANPESAL